MGTPWCVKVGWFIKCALGLGTVEDGSICWFSAKFWDVHGYRRAQGGDGWASHFYNYHCWRCKKEYFI